MMTPPLNTPVSPSIHRSLTDVTGADGLMYAAADLLDPLDAAALTALRVKTQRDRAAGLRTFHCPDCDTALSVVVRPYGTTGIAGGGRAFFRHCGGAAAQACVAADEIARTPGAVDAARFNGRQEGPRHHDHKMRLAAMLEADPQFTDVAVERAVRHGGATRTPDVQARLGGVPVAFEVQHASPLLTTLLARADFYAAAGYRIVWLIDGDAAKDVIQLQGFQDLTWLQRGQVLALTDDLLDRGLRHECAGAVYCLLHERDDRLRMAGMPVGLAGGMDRFALSNGDGLPTVALYPASEALFAAQKDGDHDGVHAALTTLCRQAGLCHTADEALAAGLPDAIAALHTLLTGRKCKASGFGDHDATAILNVFLSTQRNMVWAPLLARAAAVSDDAARRLARDSTARKLAAALDAARHNPPASDPIVTWAPVIARLFPRLGRSRISGSPESRPG